MEVTHYFSLLKEGRQELIEYEDILTQIDKLKQQAKKNTILRKKK